MTTVYTSHRAEKFHKDPTCRARITGQTSNDWDCGCPDPCSHRSPRLWPVRGVELDEAIAARKTPCNACYTTPEDNRAVLRPATEDFGHRPVDEYADTEPSANGVTHVVCERCTRWFWVSTAKIYMGSRVTWPCTSAIVLGLAPHPEETAE